MKKFLTTALLVAAASMASAESVITTVSVEAMSDAPWGDPALETAGAEEVAHPGLEIQSEINHLDALIDLHAARTFVSLSKDRCNETGIWMISLREDRIGVHADTSLNTACLAETLKKLFIEAGEEPPELFARKESGVLYLATVGWTDG